jgi:hypothetical protein
MPIKITTLALPALLAAGIAASPVSGQQARRIRRRAAL